MESKALVDWMHQTSAYLRWTRHRLEGVGDSSGVGFTVNP